MKKIAIIGAGQVGQAIAHMLARENFCGQIALIGRRAGIPQGAALDIQHAIPLYESNAIIEGSHDYQSLAGADVVVVTAGSPRAPGMSRADLIDTNKPIIETVVENVVRYAPSAIVILVSNPVDTLTYYAWRLSGWDKHRVIGLSCVLDSARMVSAIALKTGYSAKEISALVIGGHGDHMLPLPRFSSINGVPLNLFLSEPETDTIIASTRSAGGDIVALKGTSGYVAAAASVVKMLDAVMNDRNHLLPCVAIMDGEYGLNDIALGVPTVLGGRGIVKIVELPLNEAERAQLDRSVAEVTQTLRQSIP